MTLVTTSEKEIPIIFLPEMVRVIMSGRKTQTRRIVKGWRPDWGNAWIVRDSKNAMAVKFDNREGILKCPYDIGDILWVRETFAPKLLHEEPPGEYYWYKADYENDMMASVKWKPAIFMPREACRVRLKVIFIGTERVQNISNYDAISEGIMMMDNPLGAYQKLWQKINGKRNWEENPLVWVVKFERIIHSRK